MWHVRPMPRLSFAFVGLALVSLIVVGLLTSLLTFSLNASMAPGTEGNRPLAVALILAVFVALMSAWARAIRARP